MSMSFHLFNDLHVPFPSLNNHKNHERTNEMKERRRTKTNERRSALRTDACLQTKPIESNRPPPRKQIYGPTPRCLLLATSNHPPGDGTGPPPQQEVSYHQLSRAIRSFGNNNILLPLLPPI
mmetsp:Transcript_24380/g.78764  ORF Transcript_24380/g.78764 Transcript_24380/m.78764 type:complete len:122 (+) Transcript_24380:291-656(+)